MNLKRFAILGIVINAGFLIGTSVLINWSWVDNTKEKYINKVRDLTIEKLVGEIEWPLTIVDGVSIKRICNDASKIYEIQEIRISDKSGNVICLKDGLNSHESRSISKHIREVIVRKNGEADLGGVEIEQERDFKVGELVVLWSDDSYTENIHNAFYLRLGIGFLSILVMSGSAYYITRKNVKFIDSVKRILGSVRSGEYFESSVRHRIQEHEDIFSLLKEVANELTRRNSELENNVQLLNDAYNSAKESRVAKEQLVRSISHDIRTPVNMIVGIIEILTGEYEDGKHSSLGEERIANLNSAMNILIEQIDQLTEVERLQSGGILINNSRINLKDFLLETENLYGSKAGRKGIDLYVSVDKTLDIYIEIDKTKFRRILLNIMDNALKYTNRGEISVRGYKEGGSFLIEISDTGIGIKKENLQKVFETYFKEERNPDLDTGGHGIGLSIVRIFSESLGIGIGLESELGKGSRFTLKLDGNIVAKNRDKLSKNAIDVRSEIRIKALVLDDNMLNNMIIKESLSVLGVDCKTFIISEHAFEELKDNEPDIIFVDFNMPDMNGIEFVEELRRSNLARGSRVICITGDATATTRNQLDECFDQVVYKPVRQNTLLEIINAHRKSLESRYALISFGKESN